MMMTMQDQQDSVCICMSSLLLCRAHTRAPPLVYLSSAQSLNRVYLKSCYHSTLQATRCSIRSATDYFTDHSRSRFHYAVRENFCIHMAYDNAKYKMHEITKVSELRALGKTCTIYKALLKVGWERKNPTRTV